MRLQDIAELAGVSKATVSMVLNNRKGVGDETRKRVLDVVAQHGYVPKSLVDPTQLYVSKTIRFLAFATDEVVSQAYGEQAFFVEVLRGIEAESRRLGFEVTFSTLRSFDEFTQIAARNMSHGYLLLGTNVSETLVRDIVKLEPSTIVLDTAYEFVDANFVQMDNVGGAFTATTYLADLGHQRIGYVAGRTRITNFEQRRKGFDAALARRGLRLDPADVLTVPTEPDVAEHALVPLLRTRAESLPTAFFCENDFLAIAMLRALSATGVRVPEEVSVMGFDNVGRSALVEPPLTTMNVDKHAMGSLAVRRLVEVCDSDTSTEVRKIAMVTRLVERASCAPPPGVGAVEDHVLTEVVQTE